MKKTKLERWLLLEQSGEISPRQLRKLQRELEVSDEARKLRNELRQWKGLITEPDAEPSPWAATRIAARLRNEPRPATGLAWKPALALAASLAVVLGIFNFHGGQTSSAPAAVIAAAEVDVWNVPFEEDLNRLENLIVAISGDPADVMDM